MPIDPAIAVGADLGSRDFAWETSDVQLYNLALGASLNDLSYLDDVAPQVLPTFATVAATFHATEAPRVSFPGVEIDLARIVHGSQEVVVHQPIPPSGKATTSTRIAEVWDKGKAAVIVQESTTVDADGNPLWSARSSIFARGEGGFGGERGPSESVALPDRAPDFRSKRCSIGCAEIAIPCTRTRRSRRPQAFRHRFCTDCALTGSCARRSSALHSTQIPRESRAFEQSSPASSIQASRCVAGSGATAANCWLQ